ncbi:hypothetical protein FBU30_001485 [Linnemannia zychae]|nr:hypothetical protein FBU30_001485 [Linnemannia zychae]
MPPHLILSQSQLANTITQESHFTPSPSLFIKAKGGSKQRPPPGRMRQFVLKPYKEPATPAAESAETSDSDYNNSKQAPRLQPKSNPRSKPEPAHTWKLQLIRSMEKTYPISALPIGTLQVNIKRTTPNQPSLHQAVTLYTGSLPQS